MKIGGYVKLGPTVDTLWGNYDSPYVTAPRAGRVEEYLPPSIRGRHPFRTQPRDLSLLPTDPADSAMMLEDQAVRYRSSLPPAPDYAHGVGEDAPAPVASTLKWVGVALGVVVAVMFIPALLAGKKR
jgi:hypothetical protein